MHATNTSIYLNDNGFAAPNGVYPLNS